MSTKFRNCATGLLGLFLLAQTISAAPLSRAFEVRYFTTNAAANGETDFKGKTEFLSTEQRVDFLRAYAEYGRIFWRDPRLDEEVFPLAEARVRTQQIKPQPRPQVRVRLLQGEWAWQGQPSPKSAKKEAVWSSADLRSEHGRLDFLKSAKVTQPIEPVVNWRGRLQVQLDVSKTKEESTVALDQGIVVGCDAKQRFFHVTEQKRVFPEITVDATSVAMAVEVDFTMRRFNVKLNDKLVADYVPFSDPQAASFSQLKIHGAANLSVRQIYGATYLKLEADPPGTQRPDAPQCLWCLRAGTLRG